MSFITTQIGMFSYSGLSKDQMVRLRSEFGVYGTDTGRMCVAARSTARISTSRLPGHPPKSSWRDAPFRFFALTALLALGQCRASAGLG